MNGDVKNCILGRKSDEVIERERERAARDQDVRLPESLDGDVLKPIES